MFLVEHLFHKQVVIYCKFFCTHYIPSCVCFCFGLYDVSLCAQVGCPDKSREAPLVLKELYDKDVAEEDIIIAWHGKQDAAKVGALVRSVGVELD